MSDPEMPPASPSRRRSCLPAILIGVAVVLILGIGAWVWMNRPIRPVELSEAEKAALQTKVEKLEAPPEPVYEKGARELVFTERELNGLLHQNTQLGEKLRFELATDAVHARILTDLDPDLPLVGGRTLRAQARILVRMIDDRPSLVLDDVTVWGISLPNAWLAELKGKDLLEETMRDSSGLAAGVESIEIRPGTLRLRLAE